jgi:hypothetical protein
MLEAYEKESLQIDPDVYEIYNAGLEDESIKEMEDIELFIRTLGHTLLALSQKAFIRNQIIKQLKTRNRQNS